MKKPQIAIVCLLSVFIVAIAGSASAYNAAYEATCYSGASPTIDGQYVVGDEWGSSLGVDFGTNGVWRSQWCMAPAVYASFLIETADATNDAGDYWVICFDSTDAGSTTPPDGGSVPQTNDYKLVVTGHDSPTVQWYVGDGTQWVTKATPGSFADPAIFDQAQSLSTSPKIATAHYIWEMHIDKTNTDLGTTPMGYNWAQYVGYYDATTDTLQSWPPTPAADTNPDSWGYVPYSSDPNPTPDVPENFGFIAVAMLSCFAVVAGTVIYRKRK